jgi:hypothetical protein
MMLDDSFDRNHQYTEDELISMIKNRSVRQMTVLITQRNLSGHFCSTYLFDERYSLCDADEYIDVHDVVKYQPHLKDYYFSGVSES